MRYLLSIFGEEFIGKSIFTKIFIFICLLTLQNCATILHGGSQRISVGSNPSGAIVSADGQGSSKTPTTLKLTRKMDHVLIIEKEGYQQEQIVIMHVISGAVAGNILAGGIIGWGVDALTGAQYRLVPETVHVELKPLTEDSKEAKSPMLDMTIDEKLRRLKGLLDEKLITDVEYQAMRKIILESINEKK